MNLVKNSSLIGQAIISYLQNKGYPEIALFFAQDEASRFFKNILFLSFFLDLFIFFFLILFLHKIRFKLALECGNIEVALESARELNEPSAWNQLAEAALKQVYT